MAVAKSPLNLRREHGHQVLSKFREQLPLFGSVARSRMRAHSAASVRSFSSRTCMSFIGSLAVPLPEHYKYLPPTTSEHGDHLIGISVPGHGGRPHPPAHRTAGPPSSPSAARGRLARGGFAQHQSEIGYSR
ncbi:hypothetical protein ACVWXO_005923 [Bradyrhizobium sp. LM2.7]